MAQKKTGVILLSMSLQLWTYLADRIFTVTLMAHLPPFCSSVACDVYYVLYCG